MYLFSPVMATSKRQVSFFIVIETDLWKKFSKKCIDEGRTKTDAMKELIESYIKK